MTSSRIAVCPGTYDPVTNGHLDTIRRASTIFDRAIVAVVKNPPRKQTLFSADERAEFLREATEEMSNVQVELFDTLLVAFARMHGANLIVKGLRAISDFEYEFEMNQLNRMLAPEIESFFMMSSPNYSFLSSSGVREMAAFGGDVTELVPGPVARSLRQRFANRKV